MDLSEDGSELVRSILNRGNRHADGRSGESYLTSQLDRGSYPIGVLIRGVSCLPEARIGIVRWIEFQIARRLQKRKINKNFKGLDECDSDYESCKGY